jgi:integrase
MGLTNGIRFVFQKRGFFYFSRRVPSDLQRHYQRDRIVVALGTSSERAAAIKANALAARLDEEWLTLRWRADGDPLERFRSAPRPALEVPSAPLLSEAQHFYLDAKAGSRPKTFRQAVERTCQKLIELRGDQPVNAFVRADANAFRDSLLAQGLQPASVKRMVTTVRALLKFAAREHGLPDIQAFSGLYFDDSASDGSPRMPVPLNVIRSIQVECRKIDDEARWLVALVSDTGLRLSEAVGLAGDDVDIDGLHPHVHIRPHPWRRLKTKGSERVVPLVGAAKWSVRRALENAEGEFLFPRYCSRTGSKGNSASAALNKWLKPRVPNGCVVHSFRHSLRDRLRAVECPVPIMDTLGGWTINGIGESYGNGYGVEVLCKWMRLLEH